MRPAEETPDARPLFTREGAKLAGMVLSVVIAASGAGAGAFKFAAESGAKSATDAAALTVLKSATEIHGQRINTLETRTGDLERKADVSIKDRADIRERESETGRKIDRLGDKLDRLGDRLVPAPAAGAVTTR